MPDLDSPGWKSFRDLATPEQAARVLRDLYGEGAVEAVKSCSAAALADDRFEDHRFWTAVRAALRPPIPNPSVATWRH